MRNRTRVIAAAVVAAAVAAGSAGAAVASTSGSKPGVQQHTVPAVKKPAPRSADGEPGGANAAAKAAARTAAGTTARADDAAFAAAVASELHVSEARASAALQSLQAAGAIDSSSPAFAAAARSLGVSTQQLQAALGQAKQSMLPHAKPDTTGGK